MSPKLNPEVEKAHRMYVKAINSNVTAKVMACYDKDAQVMPPDGALVTGHKDIEKWVAGYFHAFKTHWTKISKITWVAGDFGFDQGDDYATDIAVTRDKHGKIVKRGKPVNYAVKGILIYKRQKNGKMLVYRDIWNFNTLPVIEPPRG